ncbi:uncharacterized protein BX664DRAFT_205936 [Halteromyces radiatus]|uniref:uncharacterized protein n=1 Tax=Halteromyces radiatus TaxID=101107 RepID=UPI00221FA3DE|nr:uncharacterized protein BX664DRAFT_205936 [Halteromyces radiatus]KAI8079970.1 hypothetical protein BX664DRAFT_205936 [Halteromyces radiatus]
MDVQGMPITANSPYMFKALNQGLVLGQGGPFGEARMVLLDRVNSTSSITVIPQLRGGTWYIQLADANPPLYLANVYTNVFLSNDATLMFDTQEKVLQSIPPSKGAKNFNIGKQASAYREYPNGDKVYSCSQTLMATLTNCAQCDIDMRNPELTYFTLTKVGN